MNGVGGSQSTQSSGRNAGEGFVKKKKVIAATASQEKSLESDIQLVFQLFQSRTCDLNIDKNLNFYTAIFVHSLALLDDTQQFEFSSFLENHCPRLFRPLIPENLELPASRFTHAGQGWDHWNVMVAGEAVLRIEKIFQQDGLQSNSQDNIKSILNQPEKDIVDRLKRALDLDIDEGSVYFDVDDQFDSNHSETY